MQKAKGHTLIEVTVGMAIVGVLMAIGIPTFSSSQAISGVRSTASAFRELALFARAEAIRRNGGVELLLTDEAPTEANAQTQNLSSSGRNWMVRYRVPGSSEPFVLLRPGSAPDEALPSGNLGQVITAASTASLSFNGLGGTDVSAGSRFSFSSAAAASCAVPDAGSPGQCLEVRISVSGRTQLCQSGNTAPDSRACT